MMIRAYRGPTRVKRTPNPRMRSGPPPSSGGGGKKGCPLSALILLVAFAGPPALVIGVAIEIVRAVA